MDENDVGAGAGIRDRRGFEGDAAVVPALSHRAAEVLAAGVFVLVLGVVSISQDLILTPQGGAHSYLVTWLRDVAGASVFEHSAGSQLPFWDGVNIYNLSQRERSPALVDGTPYQPDFLIILRATQIAFIGLIGLLVLYAMRLEALVPVEVSLLIIAMLMLSSDDQPHALRQSDVALLPADGGMAEGRNDKAASAAVLILQLHRLHWHLARSGSPQLYRIHARP